MRMEEKPAFPAFEIPEGIGEKMWHTVIKLLAEQEEVDITYDLIDKTTNKVVATRSTKD